MWNRVALFRSPLCLLAFSLFLSFSLSFFRTLVRSFTVIFVSLGITITTGNSSVSCSASSFWTNQIGCISFFLLWNRRIITREQQTGRRLRSLIWKISSFVSVLLLHLVFKEGIRQWGIDPWFSSWGMDVTPTPLLSSRSYSIQHDSYA